MAPPDALVFARRTPAHAALIAAREIPLASRFRWEDGMHTSPLSTPPARSPVPRCEWDRRLAALLDGDGDFNRALDARTDALAAGCLDAADEADARFYLGARLQREGRLARAAAEYDRVLALRPGRHARPHQPRLGAAARHALARARPTPGVLSAAIR